MLTDIIQLDKMIASVEFYMSLTPVTLTLTSLKGHSDVWQIGETEFF